MDGEQFEVLMTGSTVLVSEAPAEDEDEEQQQHLESIQSSPTWTSQQARNNQSYHALHNSSSLSTHHQQQHTPLEQQQQAFRQVTSIMSESDDDDDSSMEGELTWRDDPSRSLSDWTLHVKVKNTSIQSTYHVHKSVMAVGPRRSNYFSRAFASRHHSTDSASDNSPRSTLASDSIAEHQKGNGRHTPHSPSDVLSVVDNPGGALNDSFDLRGCSTRMELDRLAAQVVPVVLDYMYSSTGKLDINTHNATSLHALSAVWEMKALRRRVKEFWQEDINMENLTTYYGHARVFKDTRILHACEEYCARHIFEVGEQAVVEILSAVDPLFFLRVVTSPIMHYEQVPKDSTRNTAETTPATTPTNSPIRDKEDRRLVHQHKHECKEGDGDDDTNSNSNKDDAEKDNNTENNKEDDDTETKDESTAVVATPPVMVVDHQAPLRLSLLIAVYGNIHRTELTPSLFFRLTAATHLPTVEVKAARVLLELEDDICGNADGMTSLKERAIAVLSKHWLESCFAPNPDSQGSSGSSGNNSGTEITASSSNSNMTSTSTQNSPDNTSASNKNGTTTTIMTTAVLDADEDMVVSLPRVSGRALERFTTLALENARQRLLQCQQELQPLRAFREERQSEVDIETRLRQELAMARERCDQALQDVERLEKSMATQVEEVVQQAKTEVETCQAEKAVALEKMQKKNLDQVEALIREKEAITKSFLSEIDKLRLQARTDVENLAREKTQAIAESTQTADKLQQQNMKMQVELNNLRKEMAKQKDLAKLRKVADGGPSVMLKKKTATPTISKCHSADETKTYSADDKE